MRDRGRERHGIGTVGRPALACQHGARFLIGAGKNMRSLLFPLSTQHPFRKVSDGQAPFA